MNVPYANNAFSDYGNIFFCFQQFDKHSRNMELRNKYRHLKFLLSDESLQLLPEYQQRIEVC
jgi:antiviral helicase SKI2